MSKIDRKGVLLMRTWLAGALVSASIGVTGAAAFAQDYPARQIQGVIQWGAGGSTDNVSRAITPLVEPHLGQKVVLTNRPGATGVIATQYVASRPPTATRCCTAPRIPSCTAFSASPISATAISTRSICWRVAS